MLKKRKIRYVVCLACPIVFGVFLSLTVVDLLVIGMSFFDATLRRR